jgi:hypothetical protein
VLVQIVHVETVHLRDLIALRSEHTDALHRVNNSVHRTAGYAMTVLSTEADLERDISFVTMVLSELERRHPYVIEEIAQWIANPPIRLA